MAKNSVGIFQLKDVYYVGVGPLEFEDVRLQWSCTVKKPVPGHYSDGRYSDEH